MAPAPRLARKKYIGPALFSLGFRGFFLLAIGFALIVIPVWVSVYLHHLNLSGPFPAVDWHVHEMLFGYSAAVISGFLFTAIPNWTGRMPIQGWPLAALMALWLMGRFAIAGVFGSGPILVMVIDCSFLAAIVGVIAIEIIAGKNWRNLMVVIPVFLLLLANILFHTEVWHHGTADFARRLGLGVVIFLITLIGGRVIPSFTRNWLIKANPGPMPTPFSWFDAMCLLAGAVAILSLVAAPHASFTRLALALAGVMHLARLSRWQGVRTLAAPILLVLHIAYLFVPLGFVTLALGADIAGLHLLGIGAVGGMTMAVMMRATLGHTGRALTIGPSLIAAFAMVILAALLRAFAPELSILGVSGLLVAASLWTLGFGIALVRVGPWLWSPRVQPRKPNAPGGKPPAP